MFSTLRRKLWKPLALAYIPNSRFDRQILLQVWSIGVEILHSGIAYDVLIPNLSSSKQFVQQYQTRDPITLEDPAGTADGRGRGRAVLDSGEGRHGTQVYDPARGRGLARRLAVGAAPPSCRGALGTAASLQARRGAWRRARRMGRTTRVCVCKASRAGRHPTGVRCRAHSLSEGCALGAVAGNNHNRRGQ